MSSSINPKTTGILTKVSCTFCSNLVVLAWMGDVLSRGQAQNGVNFDFEVKFDLESQGQPPPKTIEILTKVFYTYASNLVILTYTGGELSRGQASDWRTDGHTYIDKQTDAGNDNIRRPKLASGKNPPNTTQLHLFGNVTRCSLITFHWDSFTSCQDLSIVMGWICMVFCSPLYDSLTSDFKKYFISLGFVSSFHFISDVSFLLILHLYILSVLAVVSR